MPERETRVVARSKWFAESRKIRRGGTHRIVDIRYLPNDDIELVLEVLPEPRMETR